MAAPSGHQLFSPGDLPVICPARACRSGPRRTHRSVGARYGSIPEILDDGRTIGLALGDTVASLGLMKKRWHLVGARGRGANFPRTGDIATMVMVGAPVGGLLDVLEWIFRFNLHLIVA